MGRLQRLHGTPDAEFAIVVSDQFQGQGLGCELLRRLIDVARDFGIRRVRADILADNVAMQRLCERHGFRLTRDLNEPTVEAELVLS